MRSSHSTHQKVGKLLPRSVTQGDISLTEFGSTPSKNSLFQREFNPGTVIALRDAAPIFGAIGESEIDR